MVHKLKEHIYSFEVSNKGSDVACRAELGRFPLLIAINKRILNYLIYLQNKQPDSFVRQSFFNFIRTLHRW